MKIIDNANTSIEFSAIKVGECFYYDSCLFIKINPVKQDSPYSGNAFCFANNNVVSMPCNWSVTPVNADIVIRSKGV